MSFSACLKSVLRAVLLFVAAVLSNNALAQSYPTKPVRLIVPFPPGAYTNTVTRLLAQKLSEGFGQPVVVENRAGAGGNIGVDQVAKAG